jgi:predicted amidohydrolase
MKNALTLIFILLFWLQGVEAQPSTPAQPLVFTHITVVDTANGKAFRRCHRRIQGNQIAAVGKRVSIPKDAQVVDASGQFLIPGLWDMHFHAPADQQCARLNEVATIS